MQPWTQVTSTATVCTAASLPSDASARTVLLIGIVEAVEPVCDRGAEKMQGQAAAEIESPRMSWTPSQSGIRKLCRW